MQFPQYRKYSNNKNYFKILSPDEFEEIQIIGSRRHKRIVKAELYPEKMFVRDLLLPETDHILVISETDYYSGET